jgi:GNAT superfamily N-acetyltransferase
VTPTSYSYGDAANLDSDAVVALYAANGWSSANKPEALIQALRNSHSVISAWDGDQLVGLGNAISDGFLVVYYPHLLVHPDYHGRGIGKEILRRLMAKYQGFHQHILVADGRAVAFYLKCGFTRAGETESMWIYDGDDH